MNRHKINVQLHTRRRRRYWPINALISIPLRLLSSFRNKNLWAFGCWDGIRYDDNSKYLYEYVLNTHPEINAIWLTKDSEIMKRMIQSGLPVANTHSSEGRRVMLKAGVVFYTNGLDDISNVCLSYGAFIVHLSHAASGIKKTLFQYERYKKESFRLYLKKIKDWLYNDYHFDLNIATSKTSQKDKMQVYGVRDRRKVVITGQPRNDILRLKDAFFTLESKRIEEGYRYILYLPTFRTYQNGVVRDFVESVVNDIQFNEVLSKKCMRILIKLHNADTTSMGIKNTGPNVILLENEKVESTQELLALSDMLITDFSSCCIDYALTGRPNILYAPDWQEYDEKTGIVDLWKPIYESERVLKTADELKDTIRKFLLGETLETDLNEWINNHYEDESIRGSCYCENVYREVIKRLNP